MEYPLRVKFRYDDSPFLIELNNIYTQKECENYIDLIESKKPSLATNNPLYRNQDRIIIDDNDMSQELFSRVQSSLPKKVGEFELKGINERLRFYRYAVGQKFFPHMDHWYQVDDKQISLYSILVYFNGNFKGGETRFMEQMDSIIKPEAGKVIIFQHKIRHEGCEVLSGTKYAARTDIIYKKP